MLLYEYWFIFNRTAIIINYLNWELRNINLKDMRFSLLFLIIPNLSFIFGIYVKLLKLCRYLIFFLQSVTRQDSTFPPAVI